MASLLMSAVVMLSVMAVFAARQRTDELDTTLRVRLAAHNRQYRRGQVGFAVRRNRHSHLPHAHFLRAMTGYHRSATSGEVVWGEFDPGEATPPPAVDWRAAGAVSAPREQLHCGSCWAFSAIGALEGQYFLKYGKLVQLSAQSLVDCSAEYGNGGCSGGAMDNAFKYIRDNGGIDTEESYPYEGVDNQCRSGTPLSGTGGVRVAAVRAGDEAALASAVAAGPVAVAVDASPPSFRGYSAGVYYDPACTPDNLNHAMLLVGYGSDAGGDYWLLRNTWGRSWGQRGDMKLARNRGNHCGIASAALIPVL
ncbi:procathepsin L-like [Aricia agestis]|uniref:procathepsin L-like n=1 Tax=Aricia agestis TaxID=91739 RepID=UPI001C203958|nr:procathepsin L-like [Aricia agestis]